MQIIVLGMHRSGTSAVSRFLNMMGAYFGPEGCELKAQRDNPKGFWERADVCALNDSILAAAGCSWDRVSNFHLNNIQGVNEVTLRAKLRSIILSLDAHRPWFIKDPRACLTFPWYRDLLEVPVVILVYRDPLEVAQSLQTRNGIPIDVGLALWEYYSVTAINGSLGLNAAVINYGDLMANPMREVERLYDKLVAFGVRGLEVPGQAEVEAFIDPALHHERVQAGSHAGVLNEGQNALREWFIASHESEEMREFVISDRTMEVLTSFDYGQQGEGSTALMAQKNSMKHMVAKDDPGCCQTLKELQVKLDEVLWRLDRQNKLETEIQTINKNIQSMERVVIKEGHRLCSEVKALEEKTEKANEQLSVITNTIDSLNTIIRKQQEVLDRLLKNEEPEIQFAPEQAGGKKSNHKSWSMMRQLVNKAVRDPKKTLSLLDKARLKNLYVTMFRSSPEVQRGILQFYLEIYSDEKTTVQHSPARVCVLQDKNQIINIPQFENIRVSIVIPAFNQWSYTNSCIRSIVETVDDVEYEVILADDCSTDGTVDAANYFPGLKIVRGDNNKGFLRNCNSAAEHANGEFIVMLNNDTVVHDEWLTAMLEVMSSDDEVGLVGSKLIFEDGTLQEAGGIVWKDGSGWNYGRNDDPNKPEYSYVKEVDYVSGASMMVRTHLWRQFGGFDERLAPAYYEDTDLAMQVREAGYKVLYTPFSKVTHFEGKSHGTDTSSGVKQYQERNRAKFFEKWSSNLQLHCQDSGSLFLARERALDAKIILVVDHYVPQYDRDAGSRSTFQYLKWFISRGLRVKFIGDNYHRHEPYTTVLQKMGVEVLYGQEFAVGWKKWIKNNGKNIDYAYLHRPHIAPKYIDEIRKHSNAKIIYFGHDLHYLRTQRQYELERNPELKKMAEDWKKKEHMIFSKVDVIYYPSPIEEDEVKKYFPLKRVASIPLNINDVIEPKPSSYEHRQGLMFVGGFVHQPNLDAMRWFITEVQPLIYKANPLIELIIIGSNVPPELNSLSNNNVRIVGQVSDDELTGYYNNSKIVIAPLRYGAGIKGKVLEGMKNQIPVVTTDIGAEGLPEPRDYLWIANEPKEFCEAILKVYGDRALWEEMVQKGVRCINEYFTSEAVERVVCQDIDVC